MQHAQDAVSYTELQPDLFRLVSLKVLINCLKDGYSQQWRLAGLPCDRILLCMDTLMRLWVLLGHLEGLGFDTVVINQ